MCGTADDDDIIAGSLRGGVDGGLRHGLLRLAGGTKHYRVRCRISKADCTWKQRFRGTGRRTVTGIFPKELPVIRIFVSSPGDVLQERDIATDVIEKLAKRPSYENRAVIRAVRWDDPDRHIPMLANRDPQESVNAALPRPALCDITLVIFWARMGTPLKTPGSEHLTGTGFELEDALAAKRKVLIFRRQGMPPIAEKKEERKEQQRQLEKVENFLAGLEKDGTYVDRFEDGESFRDKLSDQARWAGP